MALFGTGGVPASAEDRYTIRDSDNLAYHANELFRAFENYYHPRVAKLRQRYQLDKVVGDEQDEFRRIMLLRHWIHTTMPIDDFNATRTAWDAFDILDKAKAGGKFQCTHFAIVQHAVLNSFGYVARMLGVGPGKNETPIGGHHGTNEVWVNSLGKWVMVDAQYDLHFEKNGIPLSALEIRDEVWRNEARDVKAAFGLERKPTVSQIKNRDWGIWATAQNYRWVSWYTDTNNFTTYPANAASSTLIMYSDRIFEQHVWQRNGKPHWAYGTPYLIKIARREWIYWTPNTISADTATSGDYIRIRLKSFTPNFQTYQVKLDDHSWRDCNQNFEFQGRHKYHVLTFRVVNAFGVNGPEHRIEARPKD
jgi:hypothetical protein